MNFVKKIQGLGKSILLFLGLFLFSSIVAPKAWAAPLCSDSFSLKNQKELHPQTSSLDYQGIYDYSGRSDCEKEWTVLVYMAADNDLSEYADSDLLEMEKSLTQYSHWGASSHNIDVVTQLDRDDDEGVVRQHVYSFEKTYLNKNKIMSPEVEILPEHDSAVPQKLYDFVLWGLSKYPSKRVMLVVWGHGQGWTGGQSGYGGIAFDQRSDSRMSIVSLSEALDRFVKDERFGRPLDLLASDACLMQSMEVLTELSGNPSRLDVQSVDFIVGSTEKQSAFGLPYNEILKFMNESFVRKNYIEKQPQQGTSEFLRLDPYSLASALPKIALDSLREKQLNLLGVNSLEDNSGEILTLSSVAVSELRRSLLPELYSFSNAILEHTQTNTDDLFEMMEIVESIFSYEGENRDLGAWLQLMENFIQGKLRNDNSYQLLAFRLHELRLALSRTVISYSFGTRYSDNREKLYLAGFKAISIWIPDDLISYETRRHDFLKSKLYSFIPESHEENPWRALQDYFYGYHQFLVSIGIKFK